MQRTLFLVLSSAIVVFSIICLCTAPIINGILSEAKSWGTKNCKEISDEYKYEKDHNGDDDTLKSLKKSRNLCNRQKAMYGLEYASFISDLILGFICALLSLLHFFGVGNNFEKFTGIIGLICGIIGFILTLIYIIYSGYIFTHDGGINYNSSGPSYSGRFYKLDKDRKYAEWDDSKNQYKCLYYDKDDITALYAKYQDMGKKQYNYHKDFSFPDDDSEYNGCSFSEDFYDPNASGSSPINQASSKQLCENPQYYSSFVHTLTNCDNLYYKGNNDFGNKYLYDKWVTTIIFGCFIIALNLGLAIFGFLLFNQTGGSSGFVSAQ